MRKWQVILIVFTMFGISSCDKNSDEELIEYPVTFTSYFISEPVISVYTRNGEVTSTDLKNKTIERYKNNLTNIESVDIQKKIIATYLTENTVELTLDNNKEEKVRTVKELDGLIYWEKQDTSSMLVNIPFYVAAILKYQPLYYEEFNVPTSTGYRKAAKYGECFYVKKKDEGFEVPIFDYIYKTVFELSTVNGINNEFDESNLLLIGSNDTLIIQEYSIEIK